MRRNKEEGITLIALIITIIVLLILAGVSISIVVGDNGVLSNAIDAVEQTDLAGAKEAFELSLAGALTDYYNEKANGNVTSTSSEYITIAMIRDGLGSSYQYCSKYSAAENTDDDSKTLADMNGVLYLSKAGALDGDTIYQVTYDIVDGDITNIVVTIVEAGETISSDSYIGYFADVDGDGEVDGIIYADLAVGGSGEWYDEWGTYAYDAVDMSDLKKYYLSDETYTDTYFGTNGIIAPVSGISGEERFYVMALEDYYSQLPYTSLTTNVYFYYYNAYGNLDETYNVSTSTNDFGEGESNTLRMVASYIDFEYGSYYDGVYSEILDCTILGSSVGSSNSSVYFIPSKSEWSAFADAFEITSENYDSYGMYVNYWSSSQYSIYYNYSCSFVNGYIGCVDMLHATAVRLSCIF